MEKSVKIYWTLFVNELQQLNLLSHVYSKNSYRICNIFISYFVFNFRLNWVTTLIFPWIKQFQYVSLLSSKIQINPNTLCFMESVDTIVGNDTFLYNVDTMIEWQKKTKKTAELAMTNSHAIRGPIQAGRIDVYWYIN